MRFITFHRSRIGPQTTSSHGGTGNEENPGHPFFVELLSDLRLEIGLLKRSQVRRFQVPGSTTSNVESLNVKGLNLEGLSLDILTTRVSLKVFKQFWAVGTEQIFHSIILIE